MTLYRSTKELNRWFAFDPLNGWLMFPAELNGWAMREPARIFDPKEMCAVPLRMGFRTGIPGAPQSADCSAPHRTTKVA
jgi:hypothetical protein